MPIRRIIELYLQEFINLQGALLDALGETFGDLNIEAQIHKLPNRGSLRIKSDVWSFRRHGIGLMFSNGDGVIVDVNDRVNVPEAFDAWRLMQYIESVDKIRGDLSIELTEKEIECELINLCLKGLIAKYDNTHYVLSGRTGKSSD